MSANQPSYEELLRRLQEEEEKRQRTEQELEKEKEEHQEEHRQLEKAKEELQEEHRQLEKAKEELRPISLTEALHLWHTLYSNPKIYDPPGKIAPYHFTSPIQRLRPRRIRPWNDFTELHRQAWQEIVKVVNRVEIMRFDPKSTYKAEANRFMPKLVLRHEVHLVSYLERTVEDHLVNIFGRIGSSMTFNDRDKSSLADVTNRIEQMDLEDRPTTPPSRRRFDKVCSVTEAVGERPVLVVEYKAAHKMSPALFRDLHPEQSFELNEIIHRHKIAVQEDERRREIAEEIMAIIITQTFDYMVDQGVSYGYVTGGHAFVFLQYDPSHAETVYYHCQTVQPTTGAEGGDDSGGDDDDTLRETAVGLVAGFTQLAAIHGQAKGSGWIKRTRETLPIWMVDDATIMSRFTPSPAGAVTSKGKTITESQSPAFRGKGPSSDGSDRATRSKTKAKVNRCGEEPKSQWAGGKKEDDDEKGEENEDGAQKSKILAQSGQRQAQSPGSLKKRGEHGADTYSSSKGSHNVLYCTQACLLGLVRGGKLDARCPNVRAHHPAGGTVRGQRHLIDQGALERLLSDQLRQVPRHEDFQSLDRSGWAGALFWIRLRSHGYTLVAKGTVPPLVQVLRKEARMYGHMHAVQGRAVPVHLGSIDLARPFYLCSGVLIVHLLLLSWGGDEVTRCGLDPARLEREMARTVRDVTRLGVDQGDLRWPNLLWNKELRRVLLIDFEYGTIREERKGQGIRNKKKIITDKTGGREAVVNKNEKIMINKRVKNN